MHKTLSIALCLLLLPGCFGDDGGDGGDDPGDGTGTNTGGGTGGNTNTGGMGGNQTERETVQVTITWAGVYMVNGAYTPTTVRVPANSTVELTFVNDEQNPTVNHDLVVEGIEGASIDPIAPGDEETVTFDVGGPVATKFFCSIGNHRDNGMEGDFIVE